MLRPATSAVALAALTLLFAAAPTPAATCSVSGKERELGATYVTSVKASGTSCRRALRLVKAYHRCRRENGGADGRCRRVKGYRCTERRTTSPTQYDSKATCKDGDRRVVQQYTQNT